MCFLECTYYCLKFFGNCEEKNKINGHLILGFMVFEIPMLELQKGTPIYFIL